jgi:PAS domain-containing protein
VGWLTRPGRRRRLAAAEASIAELGARVDALSEQVTAREAVLSAIGDGIVLFGPSGRLAYANPAARDLFGRRFDSVAELTPNALREAVDAAIRRGGSAETTVESGGRVLSATAARAGQSFWLPGTSPPSGAWTASGGTSSPTRPTS